MPELSNIQTFEKMERDHFEPILDRFSVVLKKIGIWNDEVQNAFNRFVWEKEDDGSMYASITGLPHIESGAVGVSIRPMVVVMTVEKANALPDHWLCCDLLIEAERLRDFSNGQFYSTTYSVVTTLAEAMWQEFQQTGIYFTDELQDGTAFESVVEGNLSKRWQFDYALIPPALEKLYENVPVTHQIAGRGSYLEAWYTDRWKGKAGPE